MIKFVRGSKTTFIMPSLVGYSEMLTAVMHSLQYDHLTFDTAIVNENTVKVTINSCAYSCKRILDRLNARIADSVSAVQVAGLAYHGTRIMYRGLCTVCGLGTHVRPYQGHDTCESCIDKLKANS